MKPGRTETIERIQALAAGLIATSPAGHRLCLIGGFRYRLLSRSCRTSLDIDYHWDGDLESKQHEIIDVLRAKLLPEVKRRFVYDGEVRQATGPDADMIESKVIALFNRVFLEERDLVDLFLFQDNFIGDSAQRLRTKFAGLHVSPSSVTDRFASLLANRVVHVRAIDEIIEDQIDAAVAANLKAAGGGGMVFDTVAALLRDRLRIGSEIGS